MHKEATIAYPTKIATCCYCGTRAVLVLGGGGGRHELACPSCGAPLHDLKMLPRKQKGERELIRNAPYRTRQKPKPMKKKQKRQKSRWGDLFEDAFDIIEDIFD